MTNSGHGLSLSITWGGYSAFRMQLTLVWSSSRLRSEFASSLYWALSFPSFVDPDAAIVGHILNNDIDNVQREFSSKSATPFDALLDGTTLLHVCDMPGPRIENMLTLHKLAASNSLTDMVKFLIQEGAKIDASTDCLE